MEKGFVGGKYLFTDSSHLKASATKMWRKKPLKVGDKVAKVKDTKVSNTDPESGHMHRDNKPKGGFYLDHYQAAMDNANAVRLSEQGKKLYNRRSETVERSFADAKQHQGHRYARYRGLSKVQM